MTEEMVPRQEWYALQDRLGEVIRERDEARVNARVELLVQATPCADHPEEEWLELRIGGHTVLALCTGALRAIAARMRGKDMLGLPGG